MTSVQETSALLPECERNLPEEASVNLQEAPENPLKAEGTSENEEREGASENLPEGTLDNLQDVCGASENGDPSSAVPHIENVDAKDGATDTEFAAMEGELLDFEDFNNELNNSKNEDGASDNKLSEKVAIDKEDGACSEGELDADDLEEGELREPGSSDTHTLGPARQVCRFYHRGVCYYGNACRFVHAAPNNAKGNYSMFETNTHTRTHTLSAFPNQHLGRERQPPPRVPPEFVQTAPIPFCNEESEERETAWEKGLREARTLLKQANLKRKDPEHNLKKLNISLCVNEKNIASAPLPAERNELNDKHERENFSSYKGYESYDPHMGGYNERREKDSRDNPRHKRKLSVEPRFSKARNRNIAHTDIERPFENYFDPWRRSKSPNRLSRERSPHSSFSSYSSYSRSSSGSRSPASSRSSCRSSRSPSVQQKRKVSPVPETAVSPKVSSNRFGPVKKKPGPRTSSSRSRSVSRNSSRSRSLSMESVSSQSSRNSTVSHSSSGSEHEIKDLREKSAATIPDSTPLDNKFRGIGSILNSKRDLLEEKFEDAPVEMDLRYLIPKIPEKKEPVRLALTHKNPIKLTLLNKFPPSKAGFSKDSKEFAVKKPDEPLKLNLLQGVKRPLSPSGESAEPVKQTPVLLPKKSASSRRDELLKQLKAVEDAIARKRAKF